MKFKIFLVLIIVFISINSFNSCYGQSYGLGFNSYEVVSDQRTSLDLSQEKAYCFDDDFELSFELSFLPSKKIYFGYIFRIIENDKQNIDLVYDNSTEQAHFKLVVGDRVSSNSFTFPGNDLFEKWNKISLKFNKNEKNVLFTYGDKSFVQPVDLTDKGCFKILFGANRYKEFKSTDVPPMKIRNVVVSENNQVVHQWELNDTEGVNACDKKQGQNALAVNPIWIKKLHYEWQLAKHITMNGYVRMGFDEDKGIVFLMSKDSLVSYQVAANRVVLNSKSVGDQSVYVDDQVLYNKGANVLYHIYINEKQVSTFDFKTNTWDKAAPSPIIRTQFLHANKFYSDSDSSIYILGGYGHLTYKKQVQKYHVPTQTWSEVHIADSTFSPRYLAALGATKDGAYILGGYGSTTGQQILNPRHWYDLLFFDTKTRTIKKRYEVKSPKEDFVFCNSMIVNSQENSFYTFIYPKDQFNSELQLIKGSLTNPDFINVGSKIPYQFIDILSFADLFFDKTNNRFIAVALKQEDNGQTNISIYTLNAPPLENILPTSSEKASNNLIWILGGLFLLGAGAFTYYRNSQKKLTIIPQKPAKEERPVVEALVPEVQTLKGSDATLAANSIFLFGNMQVFDEDGHEITKQFSPLVKELFLVILLYSVRWEGISSEKLKELLWFDKSSESARNNRSVNIAKLKGILDKMKYCQVSSETGYWKIKTDYSKIHFDYVEYLSLVKNKKSLSKENIVQLANITKRGNFLANTEYEWLDAFKSDISNEIVDSYLGYAGSVKIADDPEFLIQLANYIFYFDPVNEEAMIIKCKALVHLGKHSLAKTTLENFAKEYSRIYGEDFRMDMPEILHS